MRGYLLDTNHSEPRHPSRLSPAQTAAQAQRQGFRLATCWSVLCELEEGIVYLTDAGQYRRTLNALMNDLRIWPLDWNLVEQYGLCAKLARQRGRML